jgi:nucleoside-diphosphate-sugar epimerase
MPCDEGAKGKCDRMKVLITGSAGFVGSQLGKELHGRGHEVVLLDAQRW